MRFEINGMMPMPDQEPIILDHPFPTATQVTTFFRALFTGRRVSDEIRREREGTCAKCEWVRQTPGGAYWCGRCGCGVSPEYRAIVNLAAYAERLPGWGCKHPERSQGKGWRR